MNEKDAVILLDETFCTIFNEKQYIKFIKELFNDFVVSIRSWTIGKEYQDYIASCKIIGSYIEKNNKRVDVLVVNLKSKSSRDRARTMQRNFIAKYLSDNEKDAALVAFYGEDYQDWRFSFVKMEYKLIRDISGKVQIAKELTPVKRFSFLVGVNEPNHTCRKQFFPLVMEDEINPTLIDIETAFSIDNVTKEFFNEYKELFLQLEESLRKVIEKNENVKQEFNTKGINSVDFTKKLLGQIVFIYFLQKKGWLGVKKGEKWGDGPKDFMRRLFGGGSKNFQPLVPYDNFFNEILEPLFYEALAYNRSADEHFYSLFNCKIPFLNGGLFEPLNDYNWVETEIRLEDKIFEKIFDTFDRFNFTVKEDEPLEKEVAVDPEMLGKVFENLLELKDRKSKGAFYTPREIVHYMCQQSLINYLVANSSIPCNYIEKFIQLSDLTLDMIINKEEQIKKYGKSEDINEEYTLPALIKENSKELDRLLKGIKIVDPAVGSGAFPVGMMNEIVKARSILSIYFDDKRSNYDLKREIIENCLYGVDIEKSAVDITKLRFWLSLIVDELDMQNIKPLPNLDHKIMCGNSLLEEFEGVKLFNEKLLGEVKKDVSYDVKQIDKEIAELYKKKGDIARGKSDRVSIKDVEKEIKKLEKKKEKLFSSPKGSSRDTTFDEETQHRIKESQKKLSEFKKFQKQYFNEQNRKLKKQLKEKIEKIEWELIEETLKEQGNQVAKEKLFQYKKNKAKPFFLWKLYFAEVFQRENPGFDVVIGNPPYIEARSIIQEEVDAYRRNYFSAGNRVNTFAFFTEQGIKLLANGGVISYIIHRNSIRSNDYKKLRRYILDNTKIMNILSFKIGVFENVTGEMTVFVLKKEKCEEHDIEIAFLNDTIKGAIEYKIINQSIFNDLPDFRFNIYLTKSIIKVLDKLNKFPKLNSYADVKQGIIVGDEKKYVLKREESEKYKPILRGKNISKYKISFDNECVYYVPGTKVLTRGKTKELFEVKEKILTQHVSSKIVAALDTQSYYYLQTINGIICFDDKINARYLLALLNSKLLNFYYEYTFNMGAEFTTAVAIANLNRLPIASRKGSQQNSIISLVDQILSITKDDDYLDSPDKQTKVKKLEIKVDQLVYKLYELTPEEIMIVEEFGK